MSACSAAGSHTETIDVPVWFGLRRRPLEVEVYDDVVMMVATRPDGTTPADARKARAGAGAAAQKIRGGAVLFKYFRHIARADLEGAVSQCARGDEPVRPSGAGVPAVVGGVPILIKLASTMTVLFLVAGFYLGLTGTIRDNDMEQALAALSGLFALGAFMLRQWGNFHRQSLIHQKQLTDNIYYRNVNNNSGIFNLHHRRGGGAGLEGSAARLLRPADGGRAAHARGARCAHRGTAVAPCSASRPTSRSTKRWRG